MHGQASSSLGHAPSALVVGRRRPDHENTISRPRDIGNSLSDYQRLCSLLGLEGNLSSKRQCCKALKSVYVNLKQFMTCKNYPQDVIFFDSHDDLVRYTCTTKSFYPCKAVRRCALGALLRGMSLHEGRMKRGKKKAKGH